MMPNNTYDNHIESGGGSIWACFKLIQAHNPLDSDSVKLTLHLIHAGSGKHSI